MTSRNLNALMPFNFLMAATWIIAVALLIVVLLVTTDLPRRLYWWNQLRPATERTYLRRKAAHPRDPVWPAKLAMLYSHRMEFATGPQRLAFARQAFREYEDWYVRAGKPTHDYTSLPRAAAHAMECGELRQARRYARDLIRLAQQHPNFGNAHHYGNSILGRLAIREGNIELAKEHLLAAGSTPGSPQLNSFGPSMALARELLERGECEAVLAYLEQCGRFWRFNWRHLAKWSKAIRGGQLPNFRGQDRR